MPHYTKAHVSVRVSTKEQGDSRLGLDAQEAACRAFCEANGMQVEAVWQDVGSGALAPSERPGLKAAREAVRRTPGSVLVVAKLDRLSRDEAVLHALAGDDTVPFYTAEDGLGMQPMMLSVKAMIAAQERRLISARTGAALQALKAKGVALGPATWADREATQAKAVSASRASRKAAADTWAQEKGTQVRFLVTKGLTYAQVAETLNAMNAPTREGGKWYASSVSRLLARM